MMFGYHSSTDVYKVLALHNKGSNTSPEVRVFSLGDNVWRDIESFPVVPLQLQSFNLRMYGGVCFGSNVNWLATNRIDPRNDDLVHQFVIISLDLSTEMNTQLIPPLGSKRS
jgi:F-box interacting protein